MSCPLSSLSFDRMGSTAEFPNASAVQSEGMGQERWAEVRLLASQRTLSHFIMPSNA